jgi:hypothetical protein
VRPPRDLLRAGARVVVPTYPLARRVASLEVAVRENAELAVPLAAQVTRLEQSLVPLLEPPDPSGVPPGEGS